jgi:hypothetical protein
MLLEWEVGVALGAVRVTFWGALDRGQTGVGGLRAT